MRKYKTGKIELKNSGLFVQIDDNDEIDLIRGETTFFLNIDDLLQMIKIAHDAKDYNIAYVEGYEAAKKEVL